jgi:tetratricopeptide (TPR) repeat protein
MDNKRILAAVLTAGLSIIPLSGHTEELFDTKTAAKHFDQGMAYLNAKNLDAAISEFEESASLNPEAEVYYYLGYAYYLKGRSGDAESRVQARENFDSAYDIDPNFSPMRYKSGEPAPAVARKKQEQIDPLASKPAQAPEPEAPQPSQTKP